MSDWSLDRRERQAKKVRDALGHDHRHGIGDRGAGETGDEDVQRSPECQLQTLPEEPGQTVEPDEQDNRRGCETR